MDAYDDREPQILLTDEARRAMFCLLHDGSLTPSRRVEVAKILIDAGRFAREKRKDENRREGE